MGVEPTTIPVLFGINWVKQDLGIRKKRISTRHKVYGVRYKVQDARYKERGFPLNTELPNARELMK